MGHSRRVFGILLAMSLAACGTDGSGDETGGNSGMGGTSGTGGTAGSGGMAGMSGGGGNAGTGGTSGSGENGGTSGSGRSNELCTNNGTCDDGEHCVYSDCGADNFCRDPSNCINKGTETPSRKVAFAKIARANPSGWTEHPARRRLDHDTDCSHERSHDEVAAATLNAESCHQTLKDKRLQLDVRSSPS